MIFVELMFRTLTLSSHKSEPYKILVLRNSSVPSSNTATIWDHAGIGGGGGIVERFYFILHSAQL